MCVGDFDSRMLKATKSMGHIRDGPHGYQHLHFLFSVLNSMNGFKKCAC